MKHHLKRLFAPLAILLALAVAFSVSFWVVGLITPEPLCEETLLRQYFGDDELTEAMIAVLLPLNIAGMSQLYDAIYDTLEDEELTAYLLLWVEDADMLALTGEETREELAQLLFDFTTDLLLLGDEEVFTPLAAILASADPRQVMEGMIDDDTEMEQPFISVNEFIIRVVVSYTSSVTQVIRPHIIALIELMLGENCIHCGSDEYAEHCWYCADDALCRFCWTDGDCNCWQCCGNEIICWRCWNCLNCAECTCVELELDEVIISMIYLIYLTYLGELNPSLGSGVLVQAMVRVMGEYALNFNSIAELRANVESTLLFAQLQASMPEIQADIAAMQAFSMHTNGRQVVDGDFPTDYAGAFIDENNVLHILLTNADNLVLYQQVIDEGIPANAPVFVQARFSLNELMTIQRTLSYDMIMLGVEWSQPCQRSNVVEIQLIDPGYQVPVLMHLSMHIPGFNEHSIVFI